MIKWMMGLGALGGGSAVALGAYGAHGLEGMPAPLQLAYQSAVQYQFYHSLALLLVALFLRFGFSRWLRVAGLAFVAGLLLFSGSIYLRLLLGVELPRLLTPAGGVAFMVGWAAVALAAWCQSATKETECRSS
ncbi:DUF423 domain-containing protein [Aestuariirhabdus litorea]|uniref:DUF423 domain-containing protein n=1 Tax=Aestuariirhabdus litorea TaxID=2528527 RepID=A0A3P3VP65_9GAMM|nr:DUF423 domain-containing protein [Aestuariirhabdus litorea]RWW93664.1 DUF423 domain-containing protein [Endozoicomonadaceae bacterium GTF-13]